MASPSYPYEEEEGIRNPYFSFDERERQRKVDERTRKVHHTQPYAAEDWEAGWDYDEGADDEDYGEQQEATPPQPPQKKAKPQEDDEVLVTRITDGPTRPPVRAVQSHGPLVCAARDTALAGALSAQ
jgi:hypothetical protein